MSEIFDSKMGGLAADLLMVLYENGRAKVSEWNAESPLRRQVYRKMGEIATFYGNKRIAIESVPQNGFIELRATLTATEMSDKLEKPDFNF